MGPDNHTCRGFSQNQESLLGGGRYDEDSRFFRACKGSPGFWKSLNPY